MFKVSLVGEPLFKIGSLSISNTVFTTWISMVVFIIVFAIIGYRIKKNRIGKVEYFSKTSVHLFYKVINGIIENEKASFAVLPLIFTLFSFITFSNWLGLVPGFIGSIVMKTSQGPVALFRSINSDITTPFAMAIASIILVEIMNRNFPETKQYLNLTINKFFSLFIKSFEILSELTRTVSLSFRLFGNVFAGEILLMTVTFLMPYFIPVPFMLLEMAIGLLQALVFSILILVFVKW
ncbi:F0F1 ATP synthase subunit A [bacterium]|nr:F0F1 ATP synthase subunit A [bacterium]